MTDKKYIKQLEEETEHLSDVIMDQIFMIHKLETQVKNTYVLGHIKYPPNYYTSSTINPCY